MHAKHANTLAAALFFNSESGHSLMEKEEELEEEEDSLQTDLGLVDARRTYYTNLVSAAAFT